MTERKKLAISQVKEIEKVGQRQIPKLKFRAADGEGKESWYETFKSTLFDLIKPGQTIEADVDTSTHEYDGQQYTDRRVVQMYVNGQPVSGKMGSQGGYRGKSPEELELSARAYALAYAKDLAMSGMMPLSEITHKADEFYAWLKQALAKPAEIKPAPAKQPVTKGSKPAKVSIDMAWLKDSLDELKWNPTTYLKEQYANVKGTTITELVASMTEDQQKEFTSEVQKRLDAGAELFPGA